tara:strand:+ start:256 stop:528 length:273 start_codon:yes stop_codon:yes gene_type:complete
VNLHVCLVSDKPTLRSLENAEARAQIIEGLNRGIRTEAILLQPQLKDILLLGSTRASRRTSHSALATADSTSHTEKRGKEETFEVLFFQK